MSDVITFTTREAIRYRRDWWRLRATVWRLRFYVRRYGVDRSARKLLKRLEPTTRYLAENAALASVSLQRTLAQDAPRILRMVNSLEYVREAGISRELFAQATIATLDRNLRYMYRFYKQVIRFRKIHFPDAPAIELREDIRAMATLSTAGKGFIGYLTVVILAGIYVGRPVFTRSEYAEPFHYAVLLVSLSAVLVLARVLTHLDYWKIEK